MRQMMFNQLSPVVLLLLSGLLCSNAANSQAPPMDHRSSPDLWGKDVAQLFVLKEKCAIYFYINRKLADETHKEFVDWGFDKLDDMAFLRTLASEMTAAAEDFAAGRIDKNWCESAKSNLIHIAPVIFQEY
jgi:hypothetical protein